MSAKLETQEVDYYPLCPHCESELSDIHWRQLQAVNAEYLFICPNCRKVIGVGVRKSAWIN